jgi:hypothetical protein
MADMKSQSWILVIFAIWCVIAVMVAAYDVCTVLLLNSKGGDKIDLNALVKSNDNHDLVLLKYIIAKNRILPLYGGLYL